MQKRGAVASLAMALQAVCADLLRCISFGNRRLFYCGGRGAGGGRHKKYSRYGAVAPHSSLSQHP